MSVRALRRGSIAASRVTAPATTNVLDLPGTSGNYVSTPDTAATSVTGDIDIRLKVSMDDWTPGAIVTFLGKYGASGSRSYMLTMEASNVFAFRWSVAGSTAITKNATTGPGFSDGTVHWIRVTLDVDNGSSQNEVKFYTSNDTTNDPAAVSWSQLGSTVTTAGTTSIADLTTQVEIGSIVSGTQQILAGQVWVAEIRNGIAGTVVAKFDATVVTKLGTRDPSTVAVIGTAGGNWTVNGSAWDWVGV